jgi:hypothetical protein
VQKISLSQEKKQLFYILGLLYTVCFIASFVIEIIIWQDPTSPAFRKYIANPFLVFLSLYQAVECFYNRLREKIIISDMGIEYQALGVGIKAKWNELGVIENSASLLGEFEVIPILRGIARKKVIPVYRFDKEWRSKNLGRQIIKYAPNIFDA